MAEFNWKLPEVTLEGVKYSISYLPMGETRLRITGSGKIHGLNEMRPWLSNQHRIDDILIDSGITEIGEKAFFDHPVLKRVWLPETLRKIGAEAFAQCPMLEEIIFERTADSSIKIDIGKNALPQWALDY